MRINQYLAHAGLCARRKADLLVSQGQIKVNGQPMTSLSYRVAPKDRVTYQGKLLTAEAKTYLLVYKPSGYITTANDPRGRKTVMDLLPSGMGRLYPVGRLDRATTGLLIMTNDGPLARGLAHPSGEVRKTYVARLDRPLRAADLAVLRQGPGVKLWDGWAKPDVIDLGKGPREVVLVLHSGRNRIIRRLFAALGYKVVLLEREAYAGLTLQGLRPGGWRTLMGQELQALRQLLQTK